MASWLPPDVESRSLIDLDWWRPPLVAEWIDDEAVWGALKYIVVDELGGDLEEKIAGLVAGPWPRVDERGRLVFAGEDEYSHVAVRCDRFAALLAEKREPLVPDRLVAGEVDDAARTELRTRELAIGDVFAARLRRIRVGDEPVDPSKWIRAKVLDITAQAREVAKVQTVAAVAGVVTDELAEAIREEAGDGTQLPPPASEA